GEDQRRHRFRLARLYREQLDQWQRALEVLRAELAERPGYDKALRELGKLLLHPDEEHPARERRERLDAWLRVIDEQVALADDDTLRLSLKLDRARVLTVQQMSTELALEAWLAVLGE